MASTGIIASFTCLFLLLSAGVAPGLEVEEEPLVIVIENGTEEAVILDCPYTLDENESGLVIKWIHSSSVYPVYQWIENNDPVSLGILKDRLDPKYEIEDDPTHKHSNIRILDPTTDLTGEYICQVSTFENELNVLRKLIVYSKPANVTIWATAEANDTVLVSCEVQDVYPEPVVNLYRMSEEEDDPVMLNRVNVVKSWDDKLYDARLEALVDENDLDGPTHFECEVTIPDTEVVVSDKTHYEPRIQLALVISGSEVPSPMAVVVVLALLGLWRI